MSGAQDKQAVLATQLASSREVWSALQDAGVSTATELRLDFFFVAPDEASARALAALLHDETDYDIGVAAGARKRRRERSWAVLGTTQETTVCAELLDRWVGWMVDVGFEHGCVFDGWGAQAT